MTTVIADPVWVGESGVRRAADDVEVEVRIRSPHAVDCRQRENEVSQRASSEDGKFVHGASLAHSDLDLYLRGLEQAYAGSMFTRKYERTSRKSTPRKP